MHWSSRPFIRIFVFYTAGLLLAYHVDFVKSISLIALLVSIFVFLGLALILFLRKNSWHYRWLNGLILGFAIVLTGIFFTNHHFKKIDVELPDSKRTFLGVVEKQPSVSEQSVKTIIKITETADTGAALQEPLKVIAFFSKDSISSMLKYGDRLVFNAELKEPVEPKNPAEFNYAAFLKRSGVVAMIYLRENSWEKLGNEPENKILAIASRFRLALLNALSENGLDEREFAVAAAVILGYDDQMDTDLQKEYVTAGAMHILCVSGLHVGIVYLVLNFVFGYFLKRRRFSVIIKTLLLLLFIWAYALLTGLAPSVWRASLMLSIFIIGNGLNRNRDPFNTLAASAVIMLVIDPMLLFNLGFQLSYSAVLGILIFYRPIYTLLYIKIPLIDKIWSIVVVSTAAQLGTFPLAAHYFHYLPTYFWLTNILIFPLSFAIIVIGMSFIAIFWIPFVNQLVGLALSSMVYLMNLAVGIVKYLPANGLDNLYFPWLKVVLVYGLIITLFNWLLKKNLRFLLPAVILLMGLVMFQTYHHYNILNQDRMIIYSLNKNSAIDLIKGRNHCLILDTLLQIGSGQNGLSFKVRYYRNGINKCNLY